MKNKLVALFILFSVLFVLGNSKYEPELEKQLKSFSSSDEISAIFFLKDKPIKPPHLKMLSENINFLNSYSERSQVFVADFVKEKQKQGKKIDYKRYWIFNGFSVKAKKEIIEELSKNENIAKVFLNRRFKVPPTIRERAPKNKISPLSTLSVEDNIALIRADKVWDLGYDGSGIKVGIADTGVLATHKDLLGKIILQATFDNSGNKISDSAVDNDGHGSHVAGIIAGGNNSGKYIGVAPKTSLLIAKVFNPEATYDSVTAGVQYLITNGAKIINLSLGSDENYADPVMETLVENAESLNVLIVSAIGNYGPSSASTTSPGNVPKAVGVGATDNSGEIASLSSRGPIIWSGTTYIKPDIVAPGLSIKSCDYLDPNDYEIMSGTSMACPHVAGVISLMIQANPALSIQNLKNIIKNSSIKKDGVSYPNNTYGYGLIDALNAVLSAKQGDIIPPTIESVSSSGNKYKQPITISSKITDNFSSSLETTILYKNDTLVWKNSPLTKEATSNYYSGQIDGNDVISNISYYIRAKDESGNESRYPSNAPNDTIQISVEEGTETIISNPTSVPNPFSAGKENTTFFYELSKPAQVFLKIFNINGEVVKSISVNGNFGTNTLTWDGTLEDGSIAANGIYIYIITAKGIDGSSSSTKGKMIVLK